MHPVIYDAECSLRLTTDIQMYLLTPRLAHIPTGAVRPLFHQTSNKKGIDRKNKFLVQSRN